MQMVLRDVTISTPVFPMATAEKLLRNTVIDGSTVNAERCMDGQWSGADEIGKRKQICKTS